MESFVKVTLLSLPKPSYFICHQFCVHTALSKVSKIMIWFTFYQTEPLTYYNDKYFRFLNLRHLSHFHSVLTVPIFQIRKTPKINFKWKFYLISANCKKKKKKSKEHKTNVCVNFYSVALSYLDNSNTAAPLYVPSKKIMWQIKLHFG